MGKESSMLLLTLLSLVSLVQSVDVPDFPAISNIESWIPLQYEKLEPLPLPPISNSWDDPNAEIFVGVSHYRDNRCSETLNNLFSKAKYPDRVKIGKLWLSIMCLS